MKLLRNLARDLNWLAETESDELRLTSDRYPRSANLLTAEVERWQPQAQMHEVTLSLQTLPELPALNLDRMRMSQALGNVIHNALQHTEAGGRVTVAATMEAGGGVGVSVTDDGAGIAPADLPHIFNRLYRADQSRSRRTGGMGLGLTIARAIIEGAQWYDCRYQQRTWTWDNCAVRSSTVLSDNCQPALFSSQSSGRGQPG